MWCLHVCRSCAGRGKVRQPLRQAINWVSVWKLEKAGERKYIKWDKEKGTDKRTGGLYGLYFSPWRHVGCCCRIHGLIHIIFTGGAVWFGVYFRRCMIWWLSARPAVTPPHTVHAFCSDVTVLCSCLHVSVYLCLNLYVVCVFVFGHGVGHSFESVCVCVCVCRTEMSLIKEIVGCLNLIRLHVPLTDVIVLIGSFVSFTHSADVTVDMFSACPVVCDPPSVSVGSSVCLSFFITLWRWLCVCLSMSHSIRLREKINK